MKYFNQKKAITLVFFPSYLNTTPILDKKFFKKSTCTTFVGINLSFMVLVLTISHSIFEKAKVKPKPIFPSL